MQALQFRSWGVDFLWPTFLSNQHRDAVVSTFPRQVIPFSVVLHRCPLQCESAAADLLVGSFEDGGSRALRPRIARSSVTVVSIIPQTAASSSPRLLAAPPLVDVRVLPDGALASMAAPTTPAARDRGGYDDGTRQCACTMTLMPSTAVDFAPEDETSLHLDWSRLRAKPRVSLKSYDNGHGERTGTGERRGCACGRPENCGSN